METANYTSVLSLTPAGERRKPSAPLLEELLPTPLYEEIKHRPNRAARALDAVAAILGLMEMPIVANQLRGKLARGGFNLMPEDDHTPPEMAAKLAYTELQTLRLRLTTLVMYPPMASRSNPDPLNNLPFSPDEEVNILHAIRREASNYLKASPNDGTFHELKNLCQLALGNLQQMGTPRPQLVQPLRAHEVML